MTGVSTGEDSEHRLAEAMRAQAAGMGRPGFAGRNPSSVPGPPGAVAPPEPPGLWGALVSSRLPLLLALLGGVVLGVALALLSLLAPGVLPTLG